MRDLIKPTLFIVARLGLFLAVVAWIVGQWWVVRCVLPFGREELRFVLVDQGWIAMRQEIDLFRFSEPDEPSIVEVFKHGQAYTDFGETNPLFQITAYGLAPGIVFIPFYRAFRLTIRHWSACFIFTTFNIFLHWFYRKRPEVQPCEN